MANKKQDTSSLLSTILGRRVNCYYEDFFKTDTQLIARGFTKQEVRKIRAVRRLIEQKYKNDLRNVTIRSDNDIVKYFKHTGYTSYECVYGVYLDEQRRVVHQEMLAKGTTHSASIRPKEIIGPALALGTPFIIMIHNHPTGASKPSQQDILFTHALLEALQHFEVELMDHIVISGNNKFWSMKASGILTYN